MTTTEPEGRWHTEPVADEDEAFGPDEDPDGDHDEVDDTDGMTGVLIDEDQQEGEHAGLGDGADG
jgi:hypothetical protein